MGVVSPGTKRFVVNALAVIGGLVVVATVGGAVVAIAQSAVAPRYQYNVYQRQKLYRTYN